MCINAWTREYRDERKQRQLEDKMTKKKFGRKERNVKEKRKAATWSFSSRILKV